MHWFCNFELTLSRFLLHWNWERRRLEMHEQWLMEIYFSTDTNLYKIAFQNGAQRITPYRIYVFHSVMTLVQNELLSSIREPSPNFIFFSSSVWRWRKYFFSARLLSLIISISVFNNCHAWHWCAFFLNKKYFCILIINLNKLWCFFHLKLALTIFKKNLLISKFSAIFLKWNFPSVCLN